MRGGALWILRSAGEEPVREMLVRHLGDDDRCVALGTIDGAAIGYGLLHAEVLGGSRSLGIVDELYVEPEARGVGVGQLILDHLVEWCRLHGCSEVEATVLPGDRGAKNLFERSGLVARAITVHRTLGDRSS